MSEFEREGKEIWKRRDDDGTYEFYAIVYDGAGGYDLWHVGGGKFKLKDYADYVNDAIRYYGLDRRWHPDPMDVAQAVFEYLFVDDFQHDEDFDTYEEALAWVRERIKED